MSDSDLQKPSAQHRGFGVKAREVLLEPPAPFAVVSEGSFASLSDDPGSSRSSHRGFTAKAREILLERQAHDSHQSSKCFLEAILSDFGKCHKQQSHSNQAVLGEPLVHQRNIGYDQKEALIPHSKLSRIKAHKLLNETGKTRSANEIFYDKCMKQIRNPLLCSTLEIESPRYGGLTTQSSDSQRDKVVDATSEKFQANDKEGEGEEMK